MATRSMLDGSRAAEASEPPRKKVKSKSGKGKQVASLRGDVVPLAKYLASNDKATRDRAVEALRKFLAGPLPLAESSIFSTATTPSPSWASVSLDEDPRLTSEELFKLYKGLFYCFWMSDKPVVQHQLSVELADLCLHIQPPRLTQEEVEDGTAAVKMTKAGLQLWRGFWEAMMAEWTGIDKHRVDKYLGLTRRFWAAGLRLLERARWQPDAVRDWSLIVRETVLRRVLAFASPSPRPLTGSDRVEDLTIPISLAYHVADIHFDEVRRLTSSSPPLLPLLDPFYAALASSPAGNTVFFPRVLENVIDPALASDGPEEVKRAVVKTLFDTGARQDCGHAQRRKLYAAWKERGGGADDD